jgi:hypothetical protein
MSLSLSSDDKNAVTFFFKKKVTARITSVDDPMMLKSSVDSTRHDQRHLHVATVTVAAAKVQVR